MSAFARVGTGILLSVGVASACAPKAERPPYTDSDLDVDDGRVVPRPVAPEPSLDAGETSGLRETGASSGTTDGETGEPGTSGDEPATTSEADTTQPTAGFAVLREWVGPTIWTNVERVMTASPSGEVYVTDFERVFKVVDGEPQVLLSSDALAFEGTEEMAGLAADNDGNVHVFIQTLNGVAADHVFDAQGNPVEERPIADSGRLHYPTVSPEGNDVFYVDFDGLHRAMDGTDELFLDAAALGGGSLGSSCASEALVIGPQHIYYMPGCNGSPIYFGPRDGSSFGLLAEVEDIEDGVDDIVEGRFIGFEGMAAHPNGGVVVNMEQVLVWIQDDGSWQLLSTSPWPGEAEPGGSPFHSSPVAIAQSNVYLLADSHIWIADGLLE